MKANEAAPEKIYLIRNVYSYTALNTTNDYHGKYLQEWHKSREKDADVEYTHTDAFIEKACEWLRSYRQDTSDGTGYIAGVVNDKTIEDFKEYMKGE